MFPPLIAQYFLFFDAFMSSDSSGTLPDTCALIFRIYSSNFHPKIPSWCSNGAKTMVHVCSHFVTKPSSRPSASKADALPRAARALSRAQTFMSAFGLWKRTHYRAPVRALSRAPLDRRPASVTTTTPPRVTEVSSHNTLSIPFIGLGRVSNGFGMILR